MSLFKIREFWSTHSEDDEYFDQNSLLVTKLNSDTDFVIAGSQSGVLRIFKPSCEITENNNLGGYLPTDLLIEKLFDIPILQVGCGRLVSGSQNYQIAVLHPRKVSIYHLNIKEGATEHGNEFILQLVYEHLLKKSAANFAIGPFGGTQNRDFICVQSLDGQLSFFEQENFTFNCIIPEFLLPGPLSYVKKSDSIVTSSSNWCIVSYKYKLLSEYNGDQASEKNFSHDWCYYLGEAVLEISVIDDFINKESWIMVLGERNFYCLNDNGKIKFMKRLDFSPICFSTYILNDKIISMVISETNTLLIYQNTSLKWSAQLQFLPIAIRRGFFKTIKGAIVMLSEEGILECGYLGTEPKLFVAPPLTTQELDFEQAEVELATLNKIIKSAYGNDVKVTNTTAERELALKITVSPHLETCIFEDNLKNALNNQMCSISIDLLPQAIFEEVQISLFVQRPLKVTPQVEYYSNLCERTVLKCHAFLDEAFDVPSLSLQVVLSFISNLGVPRTITKSAMLPLSLVMETCPPQKESEHKITLNINESPVNLSLLFPEFIGENSLTQANNAVGFKNVAVDGKIVSVLLAKSSERYRLQSDSFASLNLLIEQMIFRLQKHFSSKDDFSVSFSSNLPVTELFYYVNEHFQKRQKVNILQNQLSQLGAQFRVIQKRLIAKFKIKNPTPLSNMEILLDDTYSEIMKINDELEEELDNLRKVQTELTCALYVIINLMKLLKLNGELSDLLETTFCPNIYDLEGQNWEDVMDASLCFLLRTILAKSDKDRLRAAHSSFEEIKDLAKIEKHLTQVIERIQKRGPDLENQQSPSIEEEETLETETVKSTELKAVPIGSQFGESSSRLLSARKGLLRRRHRQEEAV